MRTRSGGFANAALRRKIFVGFVLISAEPRSTIHVREPQAYRNLNCASLEGRLCLLIDYLCSTQAIQDLRPGFEFPSTEVVIIRSWHFMGPDL